MDVLSSTMEAVDAHRGVAKVVDRGLGFLQNLAEAPENQVTPVIMHWQCCGREWVCSSWRYVNMQIGAYFWPFLACFVRRLCVLSAGCVDGCGSQCCCCGGRTSGDCRGCESRTGLSPEPSRGP
jgi:hypothetical protein